MELIKKLNEIQQKLSVPKSQKNSFGNYMYRSCEDILEAVKPLLGDSLILTISDRVKVKGDRYYVEATARITDGKESIEVKALAREEDEKKGMSASQLTGATSSYARKYALNGLFCIDDTKDADTLDNTQKVAPRANSKPSAINWKGNLWVKLQKVTGKKNMTEEEIIKTISDKTGVSIKSSKELTDITCRNILEMWA